VHERKGPPLGQADRDEPIVRGAEAADAGQARRLLEPAVQRVGPPVRGRPARVWG